MGDAALKLCLFRPCTTGCIRLLPSGKTEEIVGLITRVDEPRSVTVRSPYPLDSEGRDLIAVQWDVAMKWAGRQP